MTKSRGINQAKAPWSPEREALLREFYPNVPARAIADALGVTDKQVYTKAKAMGIKKSDAFLVSDLSGRVRRGKQHPSMIASQFKPGMRPWNTGTHYVTGGRSAETRFGPGNKPHTWLPLGSYRTVTEKTGRQHLERKTSEAKGSNDKRWTPVTRLVWMAAHGPVPTGCIVVFKPGQHTLVLEQITLERVECVTLADNARRNHPNSHNPELARLVQLKGAITRQVNRIQKESRA